MSVALAVIDIQNGFITDNSRHILPSISLLIERALQNRVPHCFTRFINHSDSGHVQWLKWSRFMSSPEIDIHSDLFTHANVVFDKSGYSSLTEDFKGWMRQHTVTDLYLCGIATESCVLKTAVDCFEMGIRPIVIADACASHAGLETHSAGLLVLSRFIGKDQFTSVTDILNSGFIAQTGNPT